MITIKKGVYEAVMERSQGYCENAACGRTGHLYAHHAFGGSNRKKMEMEGTVFALCYECHQGDVGVHNSRILDLHFKQRATQNLLDMGWTKQEIMSGVGRWYLD